MRRDLSQKFNVYEINTNLMSSGLSAEKIKWRNSLVRYEINTMVLRVVRLGSMGCALKFNGMCP